MRLKWCYYYHYYYFHYCWCGETPVMAAATASRRWEKREKNKPHPITIRANKSLLTTARLTFSFSDNWLADCCRAYIPWPWRNTQSWQRTKGMKLLLISWVYRPKEQLAGSFMCCTACCGCGVGVMMLRLMWAYLSLAVLCHICYDVAQKVKTLARTEQSCVFFHPAFIW